MLTADDLKTAVAARAGQDPAFRAELLAHPHAAVEKLLGVALPPHVKVQALEEPADTYVVVLPRRAAADGELDDDELEAVSGGSKKAAKSFFTTVSNLGVSVGSGFAKVEGGVIKDIGSISKSADASAVGSTVQTYWGATCSQGML